MGRHLPHFLSLAAAGARFNVASAARPRLACRALSAPASAQPPLTELDFHARADAALVALETLVMDPLDESGLPGVDVTYAGGVLTLKLGVPGTVVLNKQAPTRQLWWSSPLTGPRRYTWDAAARTWASTRTGSCLARDLAADIEALIGVHISVPEGALA